MNLELRQLSLNRRSMVHLADAAAVLVRAMVTSRPHHCNSLLADASESVLNGLQLIFNAAARFVTRGRRHDHITPVLRRLYWLHVPERIKYKLCLLVYNCLHCQASVYLID